MTGDSAMREHPKRQQLRKLATGISFFLLIMISAMWIRSECGDEWISIEKANASGIFRLIDAHSTNGGLLVRWWKTGAGDPVQPWKCEHSFDSRLERSWAYPYDGHPGTFGFQWDNHRDFYAVVFPYWAATLLLALLPGGWFIGWLRRRRVRTAAKGPRGFEVLHGTSSDPANETS